MMHLPAYLQRIGYEGPLNASLESLQRLQSLHTQSIPFENLSPFTGREVRLDLPSLVEKLVHQRRGGYCYEQNLLFEYVLETLGFRVTSLAARVRMNVPDEVLTPRSHMLLLAHLDGADYVVDTGFGGMTPTAPLKLSPGLEQQTPHGRYRLLADGAVYKIRMLSGGMKRRVMIAKALSHEPQILFLDEPTAGVDVELRRDMWQMVRKLRESGVTIILTTHYIEEAEEMADRIGIIRKGEIILVEDKVALMAKLGKKQLSLHLQHPLARIPEELVGPQLELSADGMTLVYTFDAQSEHTGIAELLRALGEHGIDFKDLQSSESSLEEIFVNLVKAQP